MSFLLPFQNTHSDEYCQLIGTGGFGRVFKMFNTLDDQYYAVKQIQVSQENIAIALKEIRILASLSHPNIIRYFYSWVSATPFHTSGEEEDSRDTEMVVQHQQHNPLYFLNIQMEYCPLTLRQYLTERLTLDAPECWTIIQQVVGGLHFLHTHKIAHLDMKPDNILLAPPHAKITDFGLASYLNGTTQSLSSSSSSSYPYGCWLYTAPEQEPSYASDIYSLGIIMFEIQHLFYTNMERVIAINQLKTKRLFDCSFFQQLILEMTDPEKDKRPSISTIKNRYFLDVANPLVICRDIVWNIVASVLELCE